MNFGRPSPPSLVFEILSKSITAYLLFVNTLHILFKYFLKFIIFLLLFFFIRIHVN